MPVNPDRFQITQQLSATGYPPLLLANDNESEAQEPVLLRHIPNNYALEPEAFYRQLRVQARRLIQLEHPSLLPLVDIEFDDNDNTVLLIMPYEPGVTLGQYLVSQPQLSEEQVRDLLTQVADGLAFLHQKGMVFLDTSPHNLYLTRDGKLRLIGYGLGLLALQRGGGRNLTLDIIDYAPPELITGATDSIGKASDVYGLGAIAHELFTLQPPFGRANKPITNTYLETLLAQQQHYSTENYPALQRLPRAFRKGLAGALAYDISNRVRTPEDFTQDLHFALTQPVATSADQQQAATNENQPQTKRRRSRVAVPLALLVLIVLASGLALFVLSSDRDGVSVMLTVAGDDSATAIAAAATDAASGSDDATPGATADQNADEESTAARRTPGLLPSATRTPRPVVIVTNTRANATNATNATTAATANDDPPPSRTTRPTNTPQQRPGNTSLNPGDAQNTAITPSATLPRFRPTTQPTENNRQQPTATNTSQPANTTTITATDTSTATNTQQPTRTPTPTPTASQTQVPTRIGATNTNPTNTATNTQQPTATNTRTRQPTNTATATDTPTATNTRRPTNTPRPTITRTRQPSPTPTTVAIAYEGEIITTGLNANIRDEPNSESSTILTSFEPGTPVTVIGITDDGQWAQIEYIGDTTAWVFRPLVGGLTQAQWERLLNLNTFAP